MISATAAQRPAPAAPEAPAPGAPAPDATARFAAAVNDFLHAYEVAWTEWASAAIASVVIEQFEITEALSEEALGSLKRRSGMAVVGGSTSMRAARPPVLDVRHWQREPSFDARAARRQVEATWQRFPASLLPMLEDVGYVLSDPAARPAGGAALLAYRRAIDVLVAGAREVATDAERDRTLRRESARVVARSRWSSA